MNEDMNMRRMQHSTQTIFRWAHDQHQKVGQTYDDGPYSDHLHSVWSTLIGFLIQDENLYNSSICDDILVAAICHDILEDTNLTYNDLKEVIGQNAADIVYDVTNELGKNRKERALKTYPKIAANPKAIMVKLADRIANTIYSKESGSSMYDKYCREFPDFKSHLYSSASLEAFPVLEEMWAHLERISGQTANS